jgi:hypothetical protein
LDIFGKNISIGYQTCKHVLVKQIALVISKMSLIIILILFFGGLWVDFSMTNHKKTKCSKPCHYIVLVAQEWDSRFMDDDDDNPE